jgi:drug/metabolite transporter (DMT)-like permease
MSTVADPEETEAQQVARKALATREHRLAVGAILLAVVALSSGSSLVKLSETPGALMAFWRLAFGSIIWAVVIVVSKTKLPWSVIKRVAPAGVLFGINILFFFSAVRETRVANAEFIGTMSPIVTAPLAALVLKERVRWMAFLAGIPAIAGVGLIVFNAPTGGEHSLKGDLLAMCAVLTWAVFLLYSKRTRPHVTVIQFMGTMSFFAALATLPLAFVAGDVLGLTGKAWLIALVIGIVNGVMGHGLIVWAQRYIGVSTISMLQVSQPAVAATWAYLLLDESVAALQIAGMVVVLVSLLAFTVVSSRR